MQAMEISRTALDVEWRRLEIVAENLANANVAGPGNGRAYRGQYLVSGPAGDFAAHIGRAADQNIDIGALAGVRVIGVEASTAPLRLVHEPGNPVADANGYVSYPAIDHAEQMTLMIRTARAYEANIVAMNMAREMYVKALELGKRS